MLVVCHTYTAHSNPEWPVVRQWWNHTTNMDVHLHGSSTLRSASSTSFTWIWTSKVASPDQMSYHKDHLCIFLATGYSSTYYLSHPHKRIYLQWVLVAQISIAQIVRSQLTNGDYSIQCKGISFKWFHQSEFLLSNIRIRAKEMVAYSLALFMVHRHSSWEHAQFVPHAHNTIATTRL